MSKYICSNCNFKSTRKTDYTRHNQSKRHLEKVSEKPNGARIVHESCIEKRNVYQCPYCENTYSSASTLARHKKACGAKMELLKEKDIQDKISITEVTTLKEKVTTLQKQVETYEMMLKSFTSPQIINYFNYICTNYPNTPVLESQKSYVNLLEAKTMTLVDVITMYHNNKKLVNFIGDYIIKTYKKKEPKEQSLWSTDVTRLTYIIREACKDNDDIWSYDKKGVKIKKIVIEPALKYIKDNLIEFCKENSSSTDEPEFSQLRASLEIIPSINDGSLADDILKYIAPEFTITQNDKAIVKI
ncbi:hypothetical protein Indivirus_2_16 [Indivirus ILV1]|uniref:C2H2-type domain-containing protein n=1 Tax=Indivirus ILV1 TaxID=1977633 RepID=A0A1V0SD45_9VIRU|nr:hypothetical protein Indivirus_2_16 [Indivirus ILV1]